MTTPNPRRLAVFAIALPLLTTLAAPASVAAADEDADAREVIAQVDDALSNRAAATGKDGLAFHDSYGNTIRLPADNSGEVTLSRADGRRISFSLPHAEAGARDVTDGISLYENGDGSRIAPIVKTDGAIQVVSIIDEKAAPTEFEFTFDLPSGASMTEVSGNVVITDSSGAWLAGVLSPQAVDANGDQVKSYLDVRGTVVTQVVDHSVGEVEYPVTAVVAAAAQLIKKVTTIANWGGDSRYAVYRTETGMNLVGAPAQTILQTYGWPQAVDLAPSRFNTTSIHQQFDCHTVWARAKDPWNLERARPSNPNWPINPQSCNW